MEMKGIPCCLAMSVLLAVLFAAGQAESLNITELTVAKDDTTVPVKTTERTGMVETSASTATTKKIQHPRRKWSEHGIENIAKKMLKMQEQARTRCQDDEFFNMELETCSKCRKYCNSEEDISRCGIECRGYFKNVKLQEQIVSTAATNRWQTDIIIVLSVLLCLAIGLLIWMVIKHFKSTERMAKIEKKFHDEPNGDKNARGPEESNESLLTNASEASGIDEPGSQA